MLPWRLGLSVAVSRLAAADIVQPDSHAQAGRWDQTSDVLSPVKQQVLWHKQQQNQQFCDLYRTQDKSSA